MWALYKNIFGKLFAFKYPNQTLDVRSVKRISNVYALSSDRIQYNHAFQTAYGTRCALREDVFEQTINEPQVQFISISLKESWVIWLSVEICFDHARILSMSQLDDAQHPFTFQFYSHQIWNESESSISFFLKKQRHNACKIGTRAE